MIEVSFERGLTDGVRLRKLAREFVRIVEEKEIIKPEEQVRLFFLPAMLVCDHMAFAFYPNSESSVRYIQVAAIDCKDKPGPEAARAREMTNRGDTPWLRYILWSVGHEFAHVEGVEDEDEADVRGEQILEAARSLSPALRHATRPE